jgi:hypothetical protein
LNNMFTNMPSTQEVIRAKEELLQMMDDKYTELRQQGKTENEAVGAVISEFGNLEELGPQLGIAPQVTASLDPENNIAMDSNQVNQYLKDVRETSSRIGLGVAMCIMSALPLILLTGFSSRIGIQENLAAAIGIGVLLLVVGIAVYLFIVNGTIAGKYDNLEKHPVALSGTVSGMIRERQDAFRPVFARKIATGVLLIILGAGLVAVTSVLSLESSLLAMLAVVVLLTVVALAVYQFIRGGTEHEAYEILLNTGDYSSSRRKGNETMDRFSGLYWAVILTGYLAWSFLTFRWDKSWIVWPIAGVLYGLISALLGAIKHNN